MLSAVLDRTRILRSGQFLLNVILAKCKRLSLPLGDSAWDTNPLTPLLLQVNKTTLRQPWLDLEQSTPRGELEFGNKFGDFRWAS